MMRQKNIGKNLDDIPKKYRNAIEIFRKKALGHESIEKIILFGSIAQGDFGKDSDIDILVVWNADKIRGWKILELIAFQTLLETNEYISLKVLTPDEYQLLMKNNSRFISNMITEGVPIG